MKGIWVGTPVVLVGVLVTGLRAGEDPPGPVTIATTGSPLPPAVTLGRPVAVGPGATQATPPAPRLDPQFQPTSYRPGPGAGVEVVAETKGPALPLPMPSGGPTLGQPQKGPMPLTELNEPRGEAPLSVSPFPMTAEGDAPIYGEGAFASDPWCNAPGLCGDGCCSVGGCGPGSSPLFWLRAEYLLWWIKNGNSPPLITTSPPSSLGVIGAPGTQVLFGNSLNTGEISGGRFTAGVWLDSCESCGLEGTFFFLGKRSARFDAASNGNPLLARPFFNAAPGVNAEDAELIANPAVPGLPGLLPLTGRVNALVATELWGAEANLLKNCCKGCWGRFDVLTGFRFLRLRETLNIDENLTVPLTSPVVPGEMIFVNDRFRTRSEFYGGQIGFRAEKQWRHWQVDVLAKFALGDTHERASISGATAITPLGGPTQSFANGLLAQPTNIGTYNRDRIAVVPEVGINVGYQFNEHWRLFAGYNFLYWSEVARPGNQVDRVVNGNQIAPGMSPLVGPARPAFAFQGTDFWAHGVNLGLEFRY